MRGQVCSLKLHTPPPQSSLASRFLVHEVKEPTETAALQNRKNTNGTRSTQQNTLDYCMYLWRFNRIIKEVQNPFTYTRKETNETSWGKEGQVRFFGALQQNSFTTGKQ